jgi:protein-S-isoprenylcysteine O-methyltransferase Ste14
MSGVLGLMRHPWYTAFIIFLWARDFDLAGLITNSVLTAYIFIGTCLEERKLITEFGQAYRDYQEKVSMLFPVKWLRSKVLVKLP